MRKLYGPTSWRRVLALVLVFAMMFSAMGTSGYSVFADESLPETEEEVVAVEAEAVDPEVTEDIQGPSPGEDEISTPAEDADETEALSEEDAEEAAELAEEELEEIDEEAVEETMEEISEDSSEEAEPAEEAEEAQEPEEAAEEAAQTEEGEEETKEAAEEQAEEPAGSIVEEFVKVSEAEPVEEPAEEPAEEAEIAYPKKTFRDFIGGMSVTVAAPEGAFPEGTEMKLAEVEIESIIDAVSDAVDGNIANIKAVDITFFYNGKEIQPLKPINVKMNASGMDADSDRQVLHIDDEGEATVVEDADTSKKTVEFAADSFSVYVIVETEDLRYTVNFVTGEDEIVSMIIKPEDTKNEVDVIIYDPSEGVAPEGQAFKGWTTDTEYTYEDSELLTIEEVRAAAMEAVAALTAESEEAEKSITYYPALFIPYAITYKSDGSDDSNPITVGMDTAWAPAYLTKSEAVYKVNKGYTVDDKHNFEGWTPLAASESYIKSIEGNAYPAGASYDELADGSKIYYYPNETKILVSGDITFVPRAPEGAWLIFNENGKGGKYNAPQFVLKGEVTKQPCEDTDMKRYGYTFGGWYDTKAHADAHGNAEDPTTVTEGKYTFGGTINEATTVYASWIPNKNASYMVIFWTQNLSRSGYEVAGSYVGKNGTVGQNIPYTFVDNGAEDYVTVTGTSEGHYTGFCLTEASKNQQIEITPEGDAVLNLYYDRIVYSFRFYLYRSAAVDGQYQAANNSGSGSDLDDLVTWNTASDTHPVVHGDEDDMYTEGSYVYDGRTYYYFTLEAYYGQNISDRWPTYDKLTWENGNEPVSYVMMVGTGLKPNPTNQGSGTVKGIVSVLDENILGATNDSNGNYMIIRFPTGRVYDWRYHIWYEALDTEEYPENTVFHEYGGKTYYEDTVMEVRSSNNQVSSQNEPKYTGFTFVGKKGENWDAANAAYWTENGELHLNYVYDREQYKISYFDGEYVNGDNNHVQNRATHLLAESELIGQGEAISSEDQNLKPALPDGEEGYVFEGWYIDEGCTQPYKWTTMLVGGIKVYAKWRQIQYRVFLHSNATIKNAVGEEVFDETLDWGSKDQALSFRVGFGEKVSAPTGLRDGYLFFGWYTDEAFSNAFDRDVFILNETTVKDAYDKENTMTDPENWPWVIDANNPNAYNSDLTGWDDDNDSSTPGKDRYWITKRLDLYAKWSKVLDGAKGINVVYRWGDSDAETLTDPAIYLDNADVTAGAAAPAPEGKVFDHWIVETWDAASGQYKHTDDSETVLSGERFLIHSSDAKKESDGVDENGNAKYKYTVQLLAVFKTPEEKTPTHINWFKNNGEAAFHTDNLDGSLSINEGVDIQPAQTRTGYKFLGWAKVTPPDKITDSYYTQSLTEEDLFLEYNEAEDGEEPYYTATVKKNGEDIVITALQVAADEKKPYDDLFAVWEALDVDYTVEFYYQSDDESAYVKAEELTESRKAKADSTVKVTDDDKAQTQDGKYVLIETSPSVLSASANADNSTVLKLYFNLKGKHLKVTKTTTSEPANGETYALGEKITYEITVLNDGERTVEKFVIVDELTGDEWEIGSLEVGETVTKKAEYIVTEDDILAETVLNVAAIAPQKPNTPTDPPSGPDTPVGPPSGPDIPVIPHDPGEKEVPTDDPDAHLVLTKEITSKSASEEGYKLGEQITYKITVKNTGNITVTNVVVKDSKTGETWKIGELAPGAVSEDLTTALTVKEIDTIEGEIVNTANATGTVPEGVTLRVDPDTATADVIKETGRKIKVIFYTNYPSDATRSNDRTPMDDAYSPMQDVAIPYRLPGFVAIFTSSMLPINYDFTGWELHRPNKTQMVDEGETISEDGTSSIASASSSSEATDPTEGADYIFYAQWEDNGYRFPTHGAVIIDKPDPDPDDPDDDPDPDDQIDDEPTPLSPFEEIPEEDIEEPDTPYAGWEEEPDEEISEEPTPLSPYTGDDRHTAAWGFVSLMSLAGIAVLGRKRREEE